MQINLTNRQIGDNQQASGRASEEKPEGSEASKRLKMDDTQRIVKCGNLSLNTPGGFFKKRWHNKYLVLYDGSKSGVKRLELFESEIKFKKQSAVKIIPLVDCVRIVTCQRHKSTFTFEVRTSDQFYLLASKSFQDTNDWVNCLRLVAFGQQAPASAGAPAGRLVAASAPGGSQVCLAAASAAVSKRQQQQPGAGAGAGGKQQQPPLLDALLERRPAPAPGQQREAAPAALTASQAAAAAASALAKTRQRQPSLLGSCKPQPPTDSPFIAAPRAAAGDAQPPHRLEGACAAVAAPQEGGLKHPLSALHLQSGGQVDTMTPTVRGQLLGAGPSQLAATATTAGSAVGQTQASHQSQISNNKLHGQPRMQIQATLDEEEENMLYCSIEDNPSEHNYRVKVIETELALRCQLKCYQLTAPKTISQQYEELAQFRATVAAAATTPAQNNAGEARDQLTPIVTFYQLIIGPQELTLLNDYAAPLSRTLQAKQQQQQQQGLWSWPYQCIRRYGFDKDNCFMFEAGRKCTSGPGQFVVQTPKAYNIYQDVVKFVNELRTIGGGGGPALNAPPSLTTEAQQPQSLPGASKPLVVTQIPVTWTPGAQQALLAPQASGGVASEVVAPTPPESAGGPAAQCRRQFFSQLSRQADTSATGPAGPIEAASFRAMAGEQRPREVSAAKLAPEVAQPLKTSGATSKVQATQKNQLIRSTAHDRLQPGGGVAAANASPTAGCPGHRQSSRPSSGSEETDESGYEQGDESVESGPTRRRPAAAPANATSASASHEPPGKPASTAAGRLAAQTRQPAKLTVQPSGASSCSLASSSASPSSSSASSSGASTSPGSTATSADSSPGQSVSRRTGESIQQRASQGEAGAASQLLINTRLSLNKVGARGGGGGGGGGRAPEGAGDAIQKTRALHEIIASDVLGPVGAALGNQQLQQQQQSIDFETSLIRDVYSEITKLHAKFAVTSTGSNGDDSMSSDSRESSGQVSDRVSNEEEDEDDDDDEEESECADDGGCYYMNENEAPISDDQMEEEPMYSNLRPIRRHPRSTNKRQPHQPVADSGSLVNKQQQQFSRSPPHQNAIRATNPSMINAMGNYEPTLQPAPLSPQSMRPIYPTILNPIPEINEPQVHNHTPRSNASGRGGPQGLSAIADKQQNDPQRGECSPRARLALNREAVIKRQQQPTTTSTASTKHAHSGQQLNGRTPQRSNGANKSKPTNHYVINDVQYAKISRGLASSKLR